MILHSLQADDRLESVLSALRAPCILFQRLVRGPGWDNFICDDYQGASDAMHYLLSRGHRRIGLVEGFGFETHSVKFRKKAWEDALAAAGIGIDPALIRDGRYDPAAAYSETRALLLMTDRPTAIRRAFSLARPGDLVALLGKGHENSIIGKAGAVPYDEIAEAEKALAEMGY